MTAYRVTKAWPGVSVGDVVEVEGHRADTLERGRYIMPMPEPDGQWIQNAHTAAPPPLPLGLLYQIARSPLTQMPAIIAGIAHPDLLHAIIEHDDRAAARQMAQEQLHTLEQPKEDIPHAQQTDKG